MTENDINRYHAAVCELQSTIERESHGYMGTGAAQQRGAFFLERMQRFCDHLGNPERTLRTIHVAGTAGKGSTTAMIYEMLVAAKQSVGMFLSPFVTTSIENIHINGRLLAPQDFVRAWNVLVPVLEHITQNEPDWYPSYAEKFFAVALIALKNAGCEWAVIETGCGGRFDYSNVIPSPVACVLTNISLDHTAVLGNTIEHIAWHKAGIIKSGAKIFSAERQPSVRAVFDAEAHIYNEAVHYIKPERRYSTGMLGEHQQWNAALAAAVGQSLGISQVAIDEGIQHARLPARIELMQQHPRVILDGAHSPAKIAALCEALESFRPWKKLHLVFAAKETKNPMELLLPLLPLADSVTITTFTLPGFDSFDATLTADIIQSVRTDLLPKIIPGSMEAVRDAVSRAESDDVVLITGSLYLAGAVRPLWISEEMIVRERNIFPDTAD